jgi:type VI protein secretion system component VasF
VSSPKVFLAHLCLIYVPPADIVAPVEREIRSLSNGLAAVKDEQEYIVVREKIHRNTAESTNTRVKWWSILQAVVLFVVVAWQVIYLKVRIQLVEVPPVVADLYL